MEHSQIEPEEMEKRHNQDLIASLKMVGEGAPVYDSIEDDWEEEVEVKEERKLPRAYQ